MDKKTQQIKNVCDFYVITHNLKNSFRMGWKVWGIDAERFESVAEHVYGTQMLAFAINSEFELGLDLYKVIFMLAFHELAEALTGDISFISNDKDAPTREEKGQMELEAIKKILAPMNDSGTIHDIFVEFEENKTKEAKFARLVDKLDCDFQVKFYEENGFNDIHKAREGIFEKLCSEGRAKGYKSLAKMWIEFDKAQFNYDEVFASIADYIAENDIYKTGGNE